MLNLISGAFHPELEMAFVERVSQLKSDPMVPLAVVAPSRRMATRLEVLLAEKGKAFLQVHFFTFSSLSQALVDEAGGLPKAVLSDSHFWDTLIRAIVKEDKPFPGLEDLAVPEGFPPQVRSTLRDLVDAGVPSDQSTLMEAIRENFLGKNVDVGWLLQLLQLYRIYTQRVSALPDICPQADVLKKASQAAPDSKFLTSFSEILFYGFYDLTGLQKELFEAVVRHHASTLFYPYVADHPAYDFSRRFREAFLLGLVQEEKKLGAYEGKTFPLQTNSLRFLDTSGLKDEAWAIAGHMRRLHHEENIPYRQMAVVSRTQDRLRAYLPSVLKEFDIPFATAVREPLSSSPFLRGVMDQLEADDSFPERASWSAFVDHALTTVDVSSLKEEIHSELNAMRRYDLIRPSASKSEFLDRLRDRLFQLDRPLPGQSDNGVQLLYAEAARGLPFDVVFVAGLEERVFPRIIREDPFLRDQARSQITTTLGYKISQKLAGLEEEKLLLHLIVGSARRHVIVTYQRSDDEGGIVGASPYARALAKEQDIDLAAGTTSFPRPYRDKLKMVPPVSLSRRDIVSRLLLAGLHKEALDFLKGIGEPIDALKEGLAFSQKLDTFGEPTSVDGVIGSVNLKQLFSKNGVSATALETMGRCPFQFFATRLLDLQPKEEEEVGLRLPADKKGDIVHSFFEDFYKALLKGEKELPVSVPKPLFNHHFDALFGSVTAADMQVHPVYWSVEKERIKKDLYQFLVADLADLRAHQMAPAYFEEPIQTSLPAPLDSVAWFGKPDRIDQGGKRIRIQDYKTGRISEKPLLHSLQGLKIQPALYILLVERFLAAKKTKVESISFFYRKLGDELMSSELTYEDWLRNKEGILKTLQTQLKLMAQGQFLIYPDEKYCSWCDVQQICRKNHGPSLYRSKKGAGVVLQEIRSKKAKS